MKMRFTPLKSFICSLFLGFHPALACEIELVIAMDVSRSVDQYEFDLMRSGTANAFRHPEIIDMINWMDGGIAVSLTQWSGLDKQRVMLPWRHLQDKSSIARFATEIDQMIIKHADGWTIERMPCLDRNILRMATFELLKRDEIPKAVIMDEAVELAKTFSTDDSGRYVNGVLSAIAREIGALA